MTLVSGDRTMAQCRLIVVACLVLVVLSGACLMAEWTLTEGREESVASFQTLVWGLGCGATPELRPCGFGFDPRLQDACDEDFGLLPGAQPLCTHHSGLTVLNGD